MQYRYEILPLDTPDDDPRWAAYEVRVEDLAQVWLGHRSVTDLARSGALTGTGDGINVLHRLLAWTTPAYNVATF